jgi:hypothetical protein
VTIHRNDATNDAKEETGMTRTDQAQAPDSTRARQTTGSVRQLLQALNWRPGQLGSPTTRWTVNVLAWAGAVLVLLSGLIHLKLYGNYQGISVIGPLFLAQGIVGILLAVALAVFRRLWLVLGGAAFLIATAAGLLISANFGLFGFQDSLAVPYATSSMVEEFIGGGVLVVTALIFLAGRPWRAQGSERVWPPQS